MRWNWQKLDWPNSAWSKGRLAVAEQQFLVNGGGVLLGPSSTSPADHQHLPSQVYIEVYEGKLRVCVWNGSSEDPVAIHVIEPVQP